MEIILKDLTLNFTKTSSHKAPKRQHVRSINFLGKFPMFFIDHLKLFYTYIYIYACMHATVSPWKAISLFASASSLVLP